jgi:murein L,D-transpeptidase YafK
VRSSRIFLAVLGIIVLILAWENRPVSAPLQGLTADSVLIEKGTRTMTLLRDGIQLKTYRVALGRNPVGAKEREGDLKTPEGTYRIVGHLERSAFHRALKLSYPEPKDVRRANALGVAPGSDIMIHGIRNGLGWLGRLHRRVDWTQGCIAVTNPEIEEIWAAAPDGTPVEIRK